MGGPPVTTSAGLDDEHLVGFVKTATWRGWRGGFLIAPRGLSKWIWSLEPVADQEGVVMVDLARLREMDSLRACRYLAEILGLPLAKVAAAMGIKHLYGPHENEVRRRLRRAQEWGTEELDMARAEDCLREHLGRVIDRWDAPLRLVWSYPPAPISEGEETGLTGRYKRCLARRLVQVRAPRPVFPIGVILADAARSAREAVSRRTGTAWLWERPISWFQYDAAWVAIGGDWQKGSSGNPFSPTRALYAMGVSFHLEPSIAYMYSATA
ncbi:MAG TPA: hypothetical protein VNV65_10080 [Candidatus Solibacter sp.]|nr:hypothetical protein [Candidatus Solibacter sp.]